MDERVRVLITDDQKPTRQGLKALLGFASQIEIIGEAVNGQEAVQMAEEHQPDVVLMDMHMPIMGGLQATRVIKSRWPEIMVVALTIYPNYRTGALEAGADAFLLKGCPAEVLQATIIEAGKRKTICTR